ncbi:uncharacterized protein LOC121530130 [Drosophila eugracilis]|uniref:uncharacterized protein LOC121530130 n=1 Tax=Drosophila eugracilis TaxID=29029 RepID=UPI001BD9489F|nr:uncharacterized protein LOC121530130 [Drosophila eugracilis]
MSFWDLIKTPSPKGNFVKLYNKSNDEVGIGGWELQRLTIVLLKLNRAAVLKTAVGTTRQSKCYSPMEKQCEDHFIQNVQKAQDSRLIVKLPFLEHTSALGESRDIATRRFLSLEKRLQKDQAIKQGYIEFMKEYEARGHMKEVPHIHLPKSHNFIPHHCVLKPDIFNGQQGDQKTNVIRNYKKDSVDRKTKLAYYRERLLTLESLWDKFNSGDNEINNFLKGVTLEHNYFNNELFKKMKQLVKDYKTEFNNKLSLLEADVTCIASTAEDIEIESMFREQRVLLDSLERIMNKMTEETKQNFTLVITQYWNDIHIQIFKKFKDPKELGYDDSRYMAAEDAVLNVQTEMYVKKETINSSPPRAVQNALHFPKVAIPKFDGDYLK